MNKLKIIFKLILGLVAVFLIYFFIQKPPTEGDWQEQLSRPSIAEFDGDMVTVKNVRNFRYGPKESDMVPGYYDKTYDLSKLKKVWFISEPFDERQLAAHTFLSFEFEDDVFISISIEARKTKDQTYNILKGFFRTYPLMYIAVDERDAVLLRTNIRKDNVYVYPVKLSKPEHAKLLFVDMLEEMNKLVTTEPKWYNSYFSNCTSSIAKHVNNIDPGRLSLFSPELFFTGNSDKLALRHGLLDTDLSIDDARIKYKVNKIAEKVGDSPDYSIRIREFK